MDSFNESSLDLELKEEPDSADYKYKSSYDAFVKWQESNGFTSIDEDIVLKYFTDSAKTLKSSTLWSLYSRLKSTIIRNNNIDISTNRRLNVFLKENSVGFESKKYKAFTTEDVNRFLVEAPDEHYLLMKAVLVFGVAGGCKVGEMVKLKFEDVKNYDADIIVKIHSANKNSSRVFVISGEFAKIVQKYMQLRPENVTTDKFFLQYRRGQCERQPIYKVKAGFMPKEIAKFLKLHDYKSYSAHSFRPTNLSHSVVEKPKLRRGKMTGDSLLPSKRLTTSANTNSKKVEKITVKPQCTATVPEVFFEITNVKTEQDDVMIVAPVTSILPFTIALMKKKSNFYLGIPPERLSRLLQLASGRKELSDVKVMLVLRKLRLNEDFELIGDTFDLDKATTERYYHESKRKVIDLFDHLPTTAPTPIHLAIKTETPFDTLADPIGVDPFLTYNYESTAENNVVDHDSDVDRHNAVDHDNFEISVPGEDRGFLSEEIRRRSAQCSICRKFFSPRLLDSHMKNVHFNLVNLNKTICGLCWKEFATKTLLKSHQKMAHGGCAYGCDVCGKEFGSKQYISTHMLTVHAKVKSYLCDNCGDGFPNESTLRDHVKRKHAELSFECHLCDKKFLTASYLSGHFRAAHTDERPFKCEICGKRFSWFSSFRSHKRVHANDKYECTICFKRFSFKGNLQNHLKTMHNEIVDNKCLASSVY